LLATENPEGTEGVNENELVLGSVHDTTATIRLPLVVPVNVAAMLAAFVADATVDWTGVSDFQP
jgi:hypothetical protein